MAGADVGALISVATQDFLPFARTTLATAAEHWVGPSLLVVVDGTPAAAQLPEGSEAVALDEVLPADETAKLKARYSVGELCCALKPFALRYALARGFERAHYLDADMAAFASLAPLDETLRAASVQLTPHSFSDLPRDDHLPDQLTLLRAGAFNAGYVGVRSCPEGLRFLDWWADKARHAGYVEPYLGMHGDQRWLDLVPAMFEAVSIVRDKGFNVGYWNLHERPLTEVNGGWLAGGAALRLFHFSGFDPRQPGLLSTYQDRHDAGADVALGALLRRYRELVMASGYLEAAPGPQPREPLARRLRDALIRRTMPPLD